MLDLAAGAGKLTRLLEPLARVVAVEPSEAMRTVLRQRSPGVDAVFVGEAFHWFRTAEAATEIARVLHTGGGLALLWNRSNWSEERNPWLPAVRELLAPTARPPDHGPLARATGNRSSPTSVCSASRCSASTPMSRG